jgi:DNA-binding NarL/FixJ family response regulator
MRVLLVDDHPIVRDGLRLAIQKSFPEAHLCEAGNGTDALAQIETSRPHLVVLDINMPGMNGLDVARRIRAMRQPPKILVLAGEIDPWTVSQALQAGVSGYMCKTNAAARLEEALATIWAGKLFLCQDASNALRQAQSRSSGQPNLPSPVVLSSREREVLKQLTLGETTKAIAMNLQISPKTVEAHRRHLMRKLGLDNIAALTHYAIYHGLIPI